LSDYIIIIFYKDWINLFFILTIYCVLAWLSFSILLLLLNEEFSLSASRIKPVQLYACWIMATDYELNDFSLSINLL